jgi:hypothetical protein
MVTESLSGGVCAALALYARRGVMAAVIGPRSCVTPSNARFPGFCSGSTELYFKAI